LSFAATRAPFRAALPTPYIWSRPAGRSSLDTTGVALNSPAYGDPGTPYDVYSNGTENVAVEEAVTREYVNRQGKLP
jgi:hypothetical protein